MSEGVEGADLFQSEIKQSRVEIEALTDQAMIWGLIKDSY